MRFPRMCLLSESSSVMQKLQMPDIWAPEDIAGRVDITGRGGTILQPGVNAIEEQKTSL